MNAKVIQFKKRSKLGAKPAIKIGRERREARKEKKAKVFAQYATYSFIDKDPVIDELRTLTQRFASREGISFNAACNRLAREAIMSENTPKAWFHGKTRRPNNCSIEAFGRAAGSKRRWGRM